MLTAIPLPFWSNLQIYPHMMQMDADKKGKLIEICENLSNLWIKPRKMGPNPLPKYFGEGFVM